ncbi:MAG: Gfo/Idh/MocA family oxidoreductase [Thermoguttaceae bacterium]|nr:Gfo/Idh/MocA family oxidoreductase [Thermoguttaceae bacterium]
MKRRDFLKTTGAIAGTGLVGMSVARGAQFKGDDVIRIGLVGCGGRGTGAIKQRLEVGDNIKVVAICDAFEEKAKNAFGMLQSMKDQYKGKITLTPDAVFSGFDSYRKVIDSCDQVLIATAPGFRPIHYKYAVEKGKHIFMEKPCCVDAPGFRMLMEANKMADDKGLCVVVGLQRHYDPRYQAFMKLYREGKLGDLMYSRVYWNGSGIWERKRQENDTEMMYQMRNWYHFNWLCGDNICEQHVHNIDVANWVHGKGDPLCHPVKANGMGGRQIRCFPRFKDSGYRWDHYFIEFTYADGTQCFSQCRQQAKCFNSLDEVFYGTKAYGKTVQSGEVWIKDRAENTLWKYEGKSPNPFQEEHIAQAGFIREGKKVNNGWYGAVSSFTACFGRMAAMSGQELTWDDAVAKGKAEFPTDAALTWEKNPPVMPDKEPPVMPAPGDVLYENSVALPGVWKWSM